MILQVVPKLIEAFTDTHAKVRQAGLAAIKDVSSVIKNPEIETLSPVLLSALSDPHEMTRTAVDELFKTRFVNAVDAPRLVYIHAHLYFVVGFHQMCTWQRS